MKWLWVVWMLMAFTMGGQNVSGQLLFVSQTPDDFKRWFVWDTVPDRPGLVLRFDVATYLGKPVCSVEDTSVSHDPRLASPTFQIPQDPMVAHYSDSRQRQPTSLLHAGF